MSDEMYPDVGIFQVVWSNHYDEPWPFIDDISSVTIVTNAFDFISIDATIVVKFGEYR